MGSAVGASRKEFILQIRRDVPHKANLARLSKPGPELLRNLR